MRADISLLVIDIGATNVRMSMVPPIDAPVLTFRAPASYPALITAISYAARTVGHRGQEVFIACPGLVTPTGIVVTALYSCVSGHTIRDDLESALNSRITVWNDANAQAFGALSALDGLGIYLTIGTAVGGGIVESGRVIAGENGFAAEVGHIPFPGNTSTCPCGKVGCVDTMASGWSIERDLGKNWHESRSGSQDARLMLAGNAAGYASCVLHTLLDPLLIALNGKLATYPEFIKGFEDHFNSTDRKAIVSFTDDAWLFTAQWATGIAADRRKDGGSGSSSTAR